MGGTCRRCSGRTWPQHKEDDGPYCPEAEREKEASRRSGRGEKSKDSEEGEQEEDLVDEDGGQGDQGGEVEGQEEESGGGEEEEAEWGQEDGDHLHIRFHRLWLLAQNGELLWLRVHGSARRGDGGAERVHAVRRAQAQPQRHRRAQSQPRQPCGDRRQG